MLKQTAFILTTFALTSCWDLYKRPVSAPPPEKVPGYKPVYSNDSSLLKPQLFGPSAIKYPGKIYVKDKLIFQNELGSGIHIIDNTDPATAKRIGFIRLLGNTEMSIKGNYIYANSYADLVVIDITNWQNIVEVKRVKQAFAHGNGSMYYRYFPLPEHGVYYECNYSSGIQTGWIKDSVTRYDCYYP